MKTSRFFHLALLAGLLTLAACAGSDEAGTAEASADAAPETRRIRVETLRVDPVTFEDVVELTGNVEAVDDATLSAQTGGTITMLRDLGTRVGAGQAVATIDPGMTAAAVEQAKAALAAAEAQYALAEDNFKRQEALYRDSVISALEYQNVLAQRNSAEAQVSQAEAALAQAEKQNSYTRVAPSFSGTVEEHFVEEGEQISPGQPVARVVNTNRVKIAAGVPERYATDIQVGTPVEISFNAYGVEPRTGRVTFVGSAINPSNRTFPIETELGNQSRQLKPEMVAKLNVTRSVLDDVLAVPLAAVIRDEDGTTLFVATGDSTETVAELREVELGSAARGYVVVESGLEAGDRVITAGQNNIAAGDRLLIAEERTSAEDPLAMRE